MTQGEGAVRGFMYGAVGITLAGAIWGGIGGAAPCGRADFFTGMLFGGMLTLVFYSLPAGVIGALLGALAASWVKDPGQPHPANRTRTRSMTEPGNPSR